MSVVGGTEPVTHHVVQLGLSEHRQADPLHRGFYYVPNSDTDLYGPINEQLQRPDSFASQLQKMLAVRQASGLYASHQILVPDVKSLGLLAMVHELPEGKGIQVTALNFGATPIDEAIVLPNVKPGPVVDMINETNEGDLSASGELRIRLDAYQGKSLRIVGPPPPSI